MTIECYEKECPYHCINSTNDMNDGPFCYEEECKMGGKGLNLEMHLHRQRLFSLKTFGPDSRTQGVLDHIRKELKEIEEDPLDLEEWIDVVLLACDGAWRAGHSPKEICDMLAAKLTKNENREWPDWRTAEPGKAIEHVRD